MTTQTIAIVGATGNQGGSVLKTFANSNQYKVRALTRNPNSETVTKLESKYPGVEWVKADLNDIDSLRKAFTGAYAVFGVTQSADTDLVNQIKSGNLDAEFDQGMNIIDAAIAENVEVAIMSTGQSMAKLSNGKYTGALLVESKHRIAKYLDRKSDQIKGVNVNMGFYLENFVSHSRISAEDGETVEFVAPLNPTSKVSFVDTANDSGPVVKHALEHVDEYRGKPIVVSGGVYEVQDAVKAFTEVIGKPARYVQVPYEIVGIEELIQMYKTIDEFGHFADYNFDEQNENINHSFVTPAEFWKNRGWSGPSI